MYNISQPQVEEVQELENTTRGQKGFCHSDSPTIKNIQDNTLNNIQAEDGIKPYDIWFSTDPFEKRLTVQIPLKGTHPTLGMQLQQTQNQHRVQLLDIMKGTPAHKLPRWRSTIKRGILLNINNKPVASSADVTAYIQQAKAQKLTHIRCKFATLQYQPLHPHEGSLMLYYDQLNVIAKHLTHSTGPTTTLLVNCLPRYWLYMLLQIKP